MVENLRQRDTPLEREWREEGMRIDGAAKSLGGGLGGGAKVGS